jgi:2-oxoglutarate ferredoxin oxidoreductase subunit alpha
VNMALGAAMTGVRTMTGSSGPGIALMQEGIGQAGAAEIPLVIVNSQRSGPSTGMPTKPEQSDIGMMVSGGNGDFPRVVLAPSDPSDAFEIGVLATNIAARIQAPVYVALDQAVGQNSVTVPPFDISAVTIDDGAMIGPGEVAALDEMRRYLITDSGISPWSPPGTPGGMSLTTGNERNEWGHVSTDAKNRKAMVDKRARKVDSVIDMLPGALTAGDPDAEIGLLGAGMESGPIREASERLAAAGIPVAVFIPRTLFPVPEETLAFIRSRARTYVIEHNASGQVAGLLRSAGAPADRIKSILRYDGLPFRAADLVDAVGEQEGQA